MNNEIFCCGNSAPEPTPPPPCAYPIEVQRIRDVIGGWDSILVGNVEVARCGRDDDAIELAVVATVRRMERRCG